MPDLFPPTSHRSPRPSGFGRAQTGLVLALSLSLAWSGSSAAAPVRLRMPAEGLGDALSYLSRAAGVELLFDRSQVAGRRAAALQGVFTPEQALDRLLVGAGMTWRRTAGGAYVIVAAPVRAPPPSPAPAAPVAVSEILVVGRRNLNTDIARSEDDIQPYRIIGRAEIASSQADSPEDLLRSRLGADVEALSALQAPLPNQASPRSLLDFRGLGGAQTLVLIDGRRLPNVPGQAAAGGVPQPDVNALPLFAVDRAEVLSSTAGGIYGPGATGGVINLVVRRDIEGLELSGSSGATTRGDAPTWHLDGAWGGAGPMPGGRITAAFSHAETNGLDFGDRDDVESARRLRFTRGAVGSYPPISPSINVVSSTGASLSLDAAHGSQSLNTTRTTVPLGALATPQTFGAAALADAGNQDLRLSPDGNGSNQSLLTATRTDAAILSLRQPFGGGVQFFADALLLRDEGLAHTPVYSGTTTLSPGEGGSPFLQPVGVSYPTPGLVARTHNIIDTQRLTAGLIARLGLGWTGEVDLTAGRAVLRIDAPSDRPPAGFDVFAPGAIEALAQNFSPSRNIIKAQDQLYDAATRLGGPLLQLPGGDLTATLLGEYRRETQPGETFLATGSATSPATLSKGLGQTEENISAYAELRAPLTPRSPKGGVLRGLELQVAGRVDRHTVSTPNPFAVFTDPADSSAVARARNTTIAFTLGARSAPIDGLVLRASVATGFLPPSAAQILSLRFTEPARPSGLGQPDPRRGGTSVAVEAPLTIASLGSPDLKPEVARSVSAGIVANPAALGGLRFSLDVTRIEKSREITEFASGNLAYFLQNEARFPSRVTRLPLSPGDMAKGYTGGVVTAIDTSAMSVGRAEINAVDFSVEDAFDTPVGRLRPYARATWEPSFRRREDPTAPTYQLAGFVDGPLRWRSNVGVDWNRAAWSAGLNVQIYDGYSVTYGQPGRLEKINGTANLLAQGSASVGPQAYLDLMVVRTLRLRAGDRLRSLEIRAGLRNLLDSAPPALAPSLSTLSPTTPSPGDYLGVGYSTYGDPRGRRFQVTATGRF